MLKRFLPLTLRAMCAAAALLAAGCAAIPQQDKVQGVRVCAAGGCERASHGYSAPQLAAGLRRLLKANEGAKVIICDSSPKTHTCESVGVCFLVVGGIVPGNACADSVVFSAVAADEQPGQISLKADVARSFLWIPVQCAAAPATLAVRTSDAISLDLKSHACAFLGAGVFSATFTLAVDTLDLGQGQVGGYWSHGVSGTGNGRGSGYLVLKFPTPMPEGENWLAPQGALATPAAQLARP